MTANSHHHPASIPLPVREQAAHWLVELQADHVSDRTRENWQQWRQAHPDHARAWEYIESFTHRLGSLSSPLAHATLAAPHSAARRQAVKALSVALFAGTAFWLVDKQTPVRRWTADTQTGTGEQRTLVLDDGSQIILNTNTAINVRVNANERVIELVRGEILVTTGHDKTFAGTRHPFLVQTEQGVIRALGTRFTVRNPDRATSHVAVFEGAVEIRAVKQQSAPRIVHTGWQTSFTDTVIAPLTKADDLSTAWTQGMLIAEEMPLGDFIAELARYRSGRLHCDLAVAHLPVTGTYPLSNTDNILDMLTATHPVELRTMTRYWVSVAPRS
jgi:transmembrane sensor